MEFLLGASFEGRFLKEMFEFYVIPMINIDGVNVGNFRCDLNGHDLNRKWNKVDKVKSPQRLIFI